MLDPAWVAVGFTAVGALLGGGVTFGIAMGKLSALSKSVEQLTERLEKVADGHEQRIRFLELQRPPLYVHVGGNGQGQA